VLENERPVELPKWLAPSEVLLKREPDEVEDENPREVEEPPKCELSMCESARLVETAEPLREPADRELPPRDEFEFTPGVRLDPEREPALVFGEAPRFAKDDEPAERFAPLAALEPFTPPRTELLALLLPPWRPKYGWLERALVFGEPPRDPELNELERPEFELNERFWPDEK
jgi:hypothetical protein